MAFTHRIVSNVPRGATAQARLSAGTKGVFTAEAWDLGQPAARAVLIPGQTAPIGVVNPPSMVLVECDFGANMDPNRDKVWITFTGPNPGQVVSANPVLLKGNAGEHFGFIVFVYG